MLESLGRMFSSMLSNFVYNRHIATVKERFQFACMGHKLNRQLTNSKTSKRGQRTFTFGENRNSPSWIYYTGGTNSILSPASPRYSESRSQT